MLDRLIRFSLANRALVMAAAVLLLVVGGLTWRSLPVEVLPDLTKPTVVILTEAPGLAPEEVERQVTVPLEGALMGVSGLTRLRSTSDVALSLVFVEFDWGADIYRARQFVQERLNSVREELPDGVVPFMTPVASLMGEIMLVGVRSPGGSLEPREVRTLADWQIRQRLQGIPGIAEVLSMGGGVSQIQVRPDPNRMLAMGVSLEELREAAAEAASNTTGGFISSGSQEIMVRNLAMTTDLDEIARTLVKMVNDRAVTIGDVAQIAWGVEPMRGDAAVNGSPGVIMSITKAPGYDSLELTAEVERAIEELRVTLPQDVEIEPLFRQADFITHATDNLSHAILFGGAMVVIVLFLFMMNLRTTAITLMAIPLSFGITMLVFRMFGVSVNSMTLGGLAVAIGMVVDDAIVDVENVFRRLRENARRGEPVSRLEVIARASAEVRHSIFYATMFIILVFVPLLFLTGVAGRLFTPIAIATIVSMAASFLVSLTVIPVLCSLLLHPRKGREHEDGYLVRGMKCLLRETWLKLALGRPFAVMGIAVLLLAMAISLYPSMGRNFLPPFNEETALVAMTTAPGTSLEQTNEVSDVVDRLLLEIPEVRKVGRRVGRAERGDHVVPVSTVEFDIDFRTDENSRPRAEVLADISARVKTIPGTFAVRSGPLADRIGHMLSGVSAKIAIKVYGDDLEEIRRIGTDIQSIAKEIPGLETARIEQQASIPQLRIEIDRERARAYGVTPKSFNEQLESLIGGEGVLELYEGQRVIDLVVRLPREWRESREKILNLYVDTKEGGRVPVRVLADVREAKGPNVIQRENKQRRFVVSINPTTPDLVALVEELEGRVRERYPDEHIEFEGEYEAQQEATWRIAVFSALVLMAIALLLYGYFRTTVFAAQVIFDIPLALIGGLALTWALVDNISIATLVGLIAVTGVAARNSVMLISHYLHLMRHEGEAFGREMVVRGTLERLVPVLMTALSAGIALLPLVFAADAPGKEILHPVAVVIVGGLVTSTLLGLGVTPAVFYAFGRGAAERAVRSGAAAAR